MKFDTIMQRAGFCLAVACLVPAVSQGQASQSARLQSPSAMAAARNAAASTRAITLEPPTGWELQIHAFDNTGKRLPEMPANFRRLGTAQAGEATPVHTLTLRFNQAARITGFSISKDFKLEQGGTCAEGAHAKDTTCTMMVRFTPQGGGFRSGKLTVHTDASASPDYAFGLGGYGLAPAISFNPAVITTVAGTNLGSGSGLLSSAKQMAIDGGDNLYIADTGNNVIRYMDSGGAFSVISDSGTPPVSPYGIGVDAVGLVWFSDATSNIWSIDPTGVTTQETGTGTDPCFYTEGCYLYLEAVSNPGAIALDEGTNAMAFSNFDGVTGLGVAFTQPYPPSFETDYDPFVLSSTTPPALGIDTADNIYTSWADGSCTIEFQTLDDAENLLARFARIAGGRNCGFAGDGGLASGAQISNTVGQIAFDTAGDLYFTDTGNQRVRMVNINTGIITTIAGTGSAGYNDDGGEATSAKLDNPTGVAVDSQGQVYIISGTAVGSSQVIRKLGLDGRLNIGNLRVGDTASRTMTVTNTGDVDLVLAGTNFSGHNPSDFALQTSTTTCSLSVGAKLSPGSSCILGFTFTPSVAGQRDAYFNLLSNTVAGSNRVHLIGWGNVASFQIRSPGAFQYYPSGSSVTFTVTVTSTTGPEPTGTVNFDYGDGQTASPTLSNGQATVTVPSIPDGTYVFTASYAGDGTWAPAGPSTVTYTVGGPAPHVITPHVSLAPSGTSGASCQPPTFNVTVSATSGPTPTGQVLLLNGQNVLAKATLSKGQAVLAPGSLPTGVYSLVAKYNGDATHKGASSATLREPISTGVGCGRVRQAGK